MKPKNFPLSNLKNDSCQHRVDEATGLDVLDVTSPHALIQAAGYLKHIRAKETSMGVFFRGQTRLYPTLGPTLLRGRKEGPPTERLRTSLKGFLADIDTNKTALRKVEPHVREPLLQHYGLKTTWLDVIDNIWVALWFACHDAMGVSGKYLHFERRIQSFPELRESKRTTARKTPLSKTLLDSTSCSSEYAHILLLESAYFTPKDGQLGLYRNEQSETIDLRVAAPSYFVRPHAQHGLLVRCLSRNGQPVGDCTKLHVGTIRVPLSAALDWLGNASTLTTHSLFPPAYYDYGYRELLQDFPEEVSGLGAIHHVQP